MFLKISLFVSIVLNIFQAYVLRYRMTKKLLLETKIELSELRLMRQQFNKVDHDA